MQMYSPAMRMLRFIEMLTTRCRGTPSERQASAAVAPSTVEQVQKVVAAANEYKVPIYPISTGMNLGYGGSAPNLSGSVVLDLKRMNNVVEVDDKRHFAILEPGVTYFDFYKYIQDMGLKVWIDTPDPGWGSPVDNALDHGVGYTWGGFRDHFHSHSGMEVVLPNGELLRTGMGAMPGAQTWGEYHYGFGPFVDGLFSQGNFGVVTKMGFHLFPQPDAYRNGMVFVPRRRDIIPLVEEINYLEHAGIIGMPEYNSPLQRLTGKPDVQAVLAKVGGPSDADLDALAKDNNAPSWGCDLQFYGPEKSIAANWDYAKERILARVPDATFKDDLSYKFPLTDQQRALVPHKVALGIPNLAIFAIGARSPGNTNPSDGHVWFSPVIPKSGEAILEAQRVFGTAVRDVKLPTMGPLYSPFHTPATWMFRAFVFISGFPVSRSNPEQNKRMQELVLKLIDVGAQHGWGEYRTPPALQEAVSNTYSFNNHVLRRFQETLKDAVDPNGIIAAGRYGIWPKHMRKA